MRKHREERFYSEKEKYKNIMASQDRRIKRHLERHKRRRRHNDNQGDEDLVKTGSDDEENFKPQRKPLKKKSMKKRDKELLDSIERRERILRKQMGDKYYLSPVDIKQHDEISSRSVAPSYSELGYYGNSLGRTFRIDRQLPIQYPIAEEEYIPSSNDYRETRYDYSRNKRASILNRAERLIDVRKQKLRELNESHSAYNGARHRQYRNNDIYVKKADDTDSGDETPYIFVKTTLTPEPISSPQNGAVSDLDVPLPPIPARHSYPVPHSAMSFPNGTKVC